MNTDHLVSMANQIGSFFESYPDKDEAQTEIANHIQRFWAPRMRHQLLHHLAQGQGEGLKDIVLSAVSAHRVRLMPVAA